MLLIDVITLALKIGPEIAAMLRALIPLHTTPAQAIVNCLGRLDGVARLIGIFDPEDKGATGVVREEPVEKRRACATDVEEAGGRWRKPNTDRGAHCAVILSESRGARKCSCGSNMTSR